MSGASVDARLARLTPKEIACLRLVARGMSSKEIASELGIAKTSVDTYCNRARAKLGVGGRHEAARLVRVAVVAEDSVAAAAGGYPFGLGDGAARSPLAPLTNATLRLLAAGIITTLAFGALMAGFHALDAMKPRRGLPTYYVSAAHPADRR
jgi:DNA-binding CsgD family transcriptional regulator